MSERGPSSPETVKEHIPSSEEVRKLFVELARGAKYTETRKLHDEKGLYRWDIELKTADGGKKEYLYIRKGVYPLSGDSAEETTIHVTEYTSDGMPRGGSAVRKCDDSGTWKRIG